MSKNIEISSLNNEFTIKEKASTHETECLFVFATFVGAMVFFKLFPACANMVRIIAG